MAAICASLPSEPKRTDAFVETVAWFWTEGTIREDSDAIRICQSVKNAGNVNQIDAALRKTFGDPEPGLIRRDHASPRWRHTIDADGQNVRFALNAVAGRQLLAVAPGRVVQPHFLRSLTQAQLDLFIRISMLGDNCGPTRLAQHDKAAAGAFQFAATLAGYGTSLIERVYKPRESVPVTQNGDYSMWGVTLQKRKYMNPVENLRMARRHNRVNGWVRERVWHDGIVWCPRTKNMTSLARRNGHCYFTGPTMPPAPVTSSLAPGSDRGPDPPRPCHPARGRDRFGRDGRPARRQ